LLSLHASLTSNKTTPNNELIGLEMKKQGVSISSMDKKNNAKKKYEGCKAE
jgi:hypothetical protein